MKQHSTSRKNQKQKEFSNSNLEVMKEIIRDNESNTVFQAMLLKPDRTGRLDREPVTAPVRTLAVNRQSAKPVKISEKPSRTVSNRLNR
jgi:hypothetical protein